VECHEVVPFFALLSGLGECSIERRARPDISERVGRLGWEGGTSGPDGQEQLEERRPQHLEWQGISALGQLGFEIV